MRDRRWLSVALLIGALSGLIQAQTLQRESVLRQRQVQERVRSMARELVGSVLDIQLQQLKENGLQLHPWYRDIESMRQHLDEIVDAEMPQVLQYLTDLEAKGADREKTFRMAREKSRDIVIRLLVERQSLLRRLRIAEMAAQARRLILAQTRVMVTTESLAREPASRRDALTLSALEDQRDVKAVYLSFTETLDEVSRWAGPFGAEASAGQRLLKAHGVDGELGHAESHLQTAAYEPASKSQRAVIRALQALLARIEQAQGMAEADRSAESQRIRDMIDRQQQLREATRQADLSQDAPKLADEQNELRQEIAALRDSLQASPDALREAEQAADNAAANLFEEKQPEAVAQQDNVIKNLEKVANQADSLGDRSPTGLSAEQYDRRIGDLSATREDLRKVEQLQREASAQSKSNPPAAAAHETQAQQHLAKIPEGRSLPESVKGALADAQQATGQAARDMTGDAQRRDQAVDSAERAVEQAVSQTEAALADARREQLGTKIAELAHAAHALDRAARAENQIAAETGKAGQNQGLDADRAGQLRQMQRDVQRIADDITQGVKPTVPKASEILQQAKPNLEQAGKQLESAQSQPGEASRPAAQETSKQAAEGAAKLGLAASEIREQLRKTFEQMAQLGGRQLHETGAVRAAVEDNLSQAVDEGSQRMQRLETAQDRVLHAQAEQAQAAGRPEAAQAMRVAQKVREALRQQRSADAAATVMQATHSEDAADSVGRQQRVVQTAADIGRQLAPQASRETGVPQPSSKLVTSAPPASDQPSTSGVNTPDALAHALQQAQQAAGLAAQTLEKSRRAEAAAARAAAREALERARAIADQWVKQLDPSGHAAQQPPDAAAQNRVTEAAGEARALAQADAPQAAETLGKAAQSSQQAQAKVAQGDHPQVASAQGATADLLAEAAKQLEEAIGQAGHRSAHRMGRQAQQADRLAQQSVPVDPGATGALRSAQDRAQQSAQQDAPLPQQVEAASQSVQQAVSEAAASLQEREDQVRRDLADAKSMADAGLQPAPEPTAEPAGGQPSGQEPAAGSSGRTPIARLPGSGALHGTGQESGTPLPVTEPLANVPIRQASQLAAEMAGLTQSGVQPEPGTAPAGQNQPDGAKPSVAASRQADPQIGGGGAAQAGKFVENQKPQDLPLQPASQAVPTSQSTPDSAGGAEPGDRVLTQSPWFAKLPPELRSAIRSNSQRRPPRGYEERLQRYFENMD